MANAKQCDICGKFYAAHRPKGREYRNYDYSDTNFIQMVSFGPDLNNPKGETEHLETCSECFNAVEAFINQIRKGEPQWTQMGLDD